MDIQQSLAALRAHLPWLDEAKGVRFEPGTEPLLYVSDDPKRGVSYRLAMDALPALTTEPNAGVPSMFTNIVDPKTYDILFAPLKVAEIFDGEEQRGSWEMISAMFPTNEFVGETASYDDFAETGVSTANANWPQRENYVFETNIAYGELETARGAAANYNVVTSKQNSAAYILMRQMNFIYAFGVSGLQNYGSTNDPGLSASLTPALKAYGGTAWTSGGVIKATPNEIFTDVQSVVGQVITQGNGQITTDSVMNFAVPASVSNALTAANSFGVNVKGLLKDAYPNLKIISGVQEYSAVSTATPQGIAAGNLIQIVVPEVATQKTATPAYSDRMRTHRLVAMTSSYRQKRSSGSWGTVIRQPFAIASMVGV